jgi:choline dehydrogenase-like flavoprotein
LTTSNAKSSDEADVLIVGAGPGGSVAAYELSRQGFSVVTLEQGFFPDRAAYPGRTPEWELLTRKTWNPNPNIRDNPQDYPVETSHSDINPLMFAGVGGSAILFNAQWTPLLPSDFRARTLDGVADDWPIDYEELLPHLEDVEQLAGISGFRGTPVHPPRRDFPTPPIEVGELGRRAIAGFDKLGWHWWPGANAIASVEHNGLKGCVRTGTCAYGCPEGAKSTTDLTLWPHSLKAGAKLVTGARVREIEVDEQGRATGAVYIDRTGRERRQRARVVILAANGVGTARLLLLSQSKRFPNGLANSSGLVGRRLMFHPYSAALGEFDEDLKSWRGPYGQIIETYQFYETDKSRGFVRGAKWGILPNGGPLGVSSIAGAKVFEDNSLDSSWGESLHRNVAARLGRCIVVSVIGEDLPYEENRVVLDEKLKDSDGIPAPKIIYKIDDNSRKLLKFHEARAVEFLEAAGAHETSIVHQMRDSGWHLLGTATMGDDPSRSVVNRWNRTHDVPNLFIVDGSVFTTSGGVNPTASIMTLSLRAARYIAEQSRNLKVA